MNLKFYFKNHVPYRYRMNKKFKGTLEIIILKLSSINKKKITKAHEKNKERKFNKLKST